MNKTDYISDKEASTTSVSQLKTPKPIYWKQVLVTTFTVYPLLMAIQWLLKLLFPMQLIYPALAILIAVAVVASLMVFPVMPLVMKVIGPWMHKK